MKKLSVVAASLLMLPVLVFSATVLAAGAGQIESGDIYRVRNVTKNTAFMDPVSATCNETVQFKVRMHNPGPSRLDNVTVVATLPNNNAMSHVSRVTVSSPTADPTSTSDNATVNLDKEGRLSYVAGTTELLDANGAKIATLGDTITSSGVAIPNGIGVSIQEMRFVQFQAKVTCKEQPQPPKDIKVCEIATKKIITIKENEFDASKHTRDLSKCEEAPTTPEKPKPTPTQPTPTELPNTGTGEVLGLFAAVMAAGVLAHRIVYARR